MPRAGRRGGARVRPRRVAAPAGDDVRRARAAAADGADGDGAVAAADGADGDAADAAGGGIVAVRGRARRGARVADGAAGRGALAIRGGAARRLGDRRRRDEPEDEDEDDEHDEDADVHMALGNLPLADQPVPALPFVSISDPALYNNLPEHVRQGLVSKPPVYNPTLPGERMSASQYITLLQQYFTANRIPVPLWSTILLSNIPVDSMDHLNREAATIKAAGTCPKRPEFWQKMKNAFLEFHSSTSSSQSQLASARRLRLHTYTHINDFLREFDAKISSPEISDVERLDVLLTALPSDLRKDYIKATTTTPHLSYSRSQDVIRSLWEIEYGPAYEDLVEKRAQNQFEKEERELAASFLGGAASDYEDDDEEDPAHPLRSILKKPNSPAAKKRKVSFKPTTATSARKDESKTERRVSTLNHTARDTSDEDTHSKLEELSRAFTQAKAEHAAETASIRDELREAQADRLKTDNYHQQKEIARWQTFAMRGIQQTGASAASAAASFQPTSSSPPPSYPQPAARFAHYGDNPSPYEYAVFAARGGGPSRKNSPAFAPSSWRDRPAPPPGKWYDPTGNLRDIPPPPVNYAPLKESEYPRIQGDAGNTFCDWCGLHSHLCIRCRNRARGEPQALAWWRLAVKSDPSLLSDPNCPVESLRSNPQIAALIPAAPQGSYNGFNPSNPNPLGPAPPSMSQVPAPAGPAANRPPAANQMIHPQRSTMFATNTLRRVIRTSPSQSASSPPVRTEDSPAGFEDSEVPVFLYSGSSSQGRSVSAVNNSSLPAFFSEPNPAHGIPFIPVIVAGQLPTFSLADTGSQVTLMSFDFFSRIDLSLFPPGTQPEIQSFDSEREAIVSASNDALHVKGVVTLDLFISNGKYCVRQPVQIFVIEGLSYEILIGIDSMPTFFQGLIFVPSFGFQINQARATPLCVGHPFRFLDRLAHALEESVKLLPSEDRKSVFRRPKLPGFTITEQQIKLPAHPPRSFDPFALHFMGVLGRLISEGVFRTVSVPSPSALQREFSIPLLKPASSSATSFDSAARLMNKANEPSPPSGSEQSAAAASTAPLSGSVQSTAAASAALAVDAAGHGGKSIPTHIVLSKGITLPPRTARNALVSIVHIARPGAPPSTLYSSSIAQGTYLSATAGSLIPESNIIIVQHRYVVSAHNMLDRSKLYNASGRMLHLPAGSVVSSLKKVDVQQQ